MAPIQRPSDLFTPGRACPLTAVVLHGYSSGIEVLNAQMNECPRRRPTAPRKCHDSFHFGIGGCQFSQYVQIEDTAWGFYFIPTPACPVPPCPIVQTCDGIGADQYNPNMDGSPANPTVAVGPDQTANCSVIHVAISNGNVGVPYCPPINSDAYRCLVRNLCYIFDQAGLLPVAGETLLTHVDELFDLDLDQLAEDILECLTEVPAPLPPCDCTPAQTPVSVVDTSSLDLTASGLNSHTLTGNVRISATAGNQTTILPDGLFTPAGGALNLNTCSGPYIDQTLVTAEAFAENTPVTNANRIWASGVEVDCPAPLLGVAYNVSLQPSDVVLGVDPLSLEPIWSRVGNASLSNVTVDETAVSVSPDNAAVVIYNGATDSIPLVAPVSARTDFWVKNVSGNVLTLTSAALIDGVGSITLQGTIPAGYPFGNNGGESVHLYWTGSTWIII